MLDTFAPDFSATCYITMFAYHTATMTSRTQKLTTNENTITNAPVNAYTTTQKIGNQSELSKQYCGHVRKVVRRHPSTQRSQLSIR